VHVVRNALRAAYLHDVSDLSVSLLLMSGLRLQDRLQVPLCN
jgi:hypothetical protein